MKKFVNVEDPVSGIELRLPTGITLEQRLALLVAVMKCPTIKAADRLSAMKYYAELSGEHVGPDEPTNTAVLRVTLENQVSKVQS